MSLWLEQIDYLSATIARDFALRIKLCGEIEWVMNAAPDDTFWQAVLDAAANAAIAVDSIAKEMAEYQYEVRLKPVSPVDAALDVERWRQLLSDLAQDHHFNADFSAIAGEIANGLHWHLHLENESGQPVFFKQDDQLSPPLRATLAGLSATMPGLMPCFAQTDAAYARLASAADHLPQTVSWGGNNRTVALRLPESVIPLRHIEHRVCAADCHAAAAVCAILIGVDYGLRHEPELGPQIYGKAGDAAYNLPRLATERIMAEAAWMESEWLGDYVEDRAALLARLNTSG